MSPGPALALLFLEEHDQPAATDVHRSVEAGVLAAPAALGGHFEKRVADLAREGAAVELLEELGGISWDGHREAPFLGLELAVPAGAVQHDVSRRADTASEFLG